MQTFLPFPDFKKSVEVLDYKRLGKQRVEAKQLLDAILDIPTKNGKPQSKSRKNHPVTQMWWNHVDALGLYMNVCIDEWIRRGYKNTMPKWPVSDFEVEMPEWFGYEPFHSSHRSRLMQKDIEFYSKYGWEDDKTNPYLWYRNGEWITI